MKTPKICHVITRIDDGGSAVNTRLSVDGLKKLGYEVQLIAGAVTTTAPMSDPVEILPHLRRNLSPWHDWLALWGLYRIFRRSKPDILHLHTSKAGFLGRLAGRLAGIKIIVYTPHGHVFAGYFGRFWTFVFLCLERWGARFTSRIVALTDVEREEELAHKVGRAEQYVVIPSGVDLEYFCPARDASERQACRQSWSLDSQQLAVGTLARLVPVKGVDLLLQAWAQVTRLVPQAVLLIAGDGPEREPLLKLTEQLGIGRSVRFLGWVSNQRDFLRALDVFVLTSRNEGMGRAVVEAMATELPVVGVAVGGIAELVVNDRTGLVVAPDNIKLLADAILRLLQAQNLRSTMGKEGRNRAQMYSVKEMIHRLDLLYQNRAESLAVQGEDG